MKSDPKAYENFGRENSKICVQPLAPPYLHCATEEEKPQYKPVLPPVAPLITPCFPLLNIAYDKGFFVVVASAFGIGTKAATIDDFIFSLVRLLGGQSGL